MRLKYETETIVKKLASLRARFSGADIADTRDRGALVTAKNEEKAVELVEF